MAYYIWAIVGIGLIIAEIVIPSFFLVFFGAGALVTAITTAAGFTTDLGTQLLVFCVSSILLLVLFRRKLRCHFGKETLPPDYMGQRLKVTAAIPRGGEGKVLYRGSEWIAFCESAEEEIPQGSTVEVTGSRDVRLQVKKL
jgi:membrane protein implicated in regulation of membrane protease activity